MHVKCGHDAESWSHTVGPEQLGLKATLAELVQTPQVWTRRHKRGPRAEGRDLRGVVWTATNSTQPNPTNSP